MQYPTKRVIYGFRPPQQYATLRWKNHPDYIATEIRQAGMVCPTCDRPREVRDPHSEYLKYNSHGFREFLHNKAQLAPHLIMATAKSAERKMKKLCRNQITCNPIYIMPPKPNAFEDTMKMPSKINGRRFTRNDFTDGYWWRGAYFRNSATPSELNTPNKDEADEPITPNNEEHITL